jgi:hypothetical protein
MRPEVAAASGWSCARVLVGHGRAEIDFVDGTLPLLKKDGRPQRSDATLTDAIAVALADVIMEGKTVYPKSGKLDLVMKGDEGEEIKVFLSVQTLHARVSRICGSVDRSIIARLLGREARREAHLGAQSTTKRDN